MLIEKPVYVYIAGPLAAGNQADNVRVAIEAADKLRECNPSVIPFVPHLSWFWHFVSPHHGYRFWMSMDLAWLAKCDCLLRLPGESKGADMEVEFAQRNGIPVFDNPVDLLWWVEEQQKEEE